jgi:hypothetical protein
MVEVGRFDARKDAEFARSLLAVAKIPCVLVPDEGADHRDSPFGHPRILVADADADDAATILRRYTTSGEDDG